MNYNDDDTNPFANPAGNRPTPGGSSAGGSSGGEYNPFTNTGFSSATPAAIQPTFTTYSPPPPPASPSYQPPTYQPPTYQPPTYQPPAYQPSTYSAPPPVDYKGFAPPVNTTQPVQQDIKQQATPGNESAPIAAQPNQANLERKNNFPPLPAWCPVQPCFYHNINLDIRSPFQRWVRLSFVIWIIYAVSLLCNVIVTAAYLAVDSGGATAFGVSFVLFLLLIPSGYVCWHRPIYRAFRADSSLFFMIFFFMSIMFIGTNILFAVGISGISRLNEESQHLLKFIS